MLANRAQIHHHTGNMAAAVADYADAAACAATLGQAEAAKQWGEAGIQLAYQVGDTVRAEQLWGDLATAYRALGDEAVAAAGARRAGADDDQPGPARRGWWAIRATSTRRCSPPRCRCSTSRRRSAAASATRSAWPRASATGRSCCATRATCAGALAAVEQQAQLAQASGNAQGVLFATANRGELLGLLGRVPEALEALQWARQTAAQYGPQLQPMVQQLDEMIAGLQQRN